MAENRVSLDFETRSRCDLPTCGAYKYAEDPSTRVLVVGIKQGRMDDPGDVLTWDVREEPNEAIELLGKAITDGWEIHAFNSQFEWVILKYVCPGQFGLPVPDINNLRCTAAVCRSAGLPPTLAKCAASLDLPVQKDTMGKALIRKFSIPQPKTGEFLEWGDDTTFTAGGIRMTAEEGFQRFVDYCAQDVRTEMAVADAMRPFELKGYALDAFLSTARLNDRGVPVDVDALKMAMRRYQEHGDDLDRQFRELTGLGPNQNAKVLEWVRERGYLGHSLDKANRASFGRSDSLEPDARTALDIKGKLSFAAVKKIPSMLDWAMSDGYIRGAFMWCGAQKTWRWASKGPQFQNMKKPGKHLRPDIESAYGDLKSGMPLWALEFLYGEPYELIASLARYFVRFPDKNIYDLDYSSVEARILPALIGCNRILDRFDSGEDIYTTTARALGEKLKEKFDVPFDIDRDTGKTIVLATQFGGGWSAVFTATGQKWKREWCEVAKAVVRKENPEFPEAWRAFQNAFLEALDNPGKWVPAGPHVEFGFSKKPPFPRMYEKLPSGRPIVMPHPGKSPITMVKVATLDRNGEKKSSRWERLQGHDIGPDEVRSRLSLDWPEPNPAEKVTKTFETWEIFFWGHTEGVNYGQVKTYGGSLLQSATQATGVDLLALGAIEAEKKGFDPFFLVHDQCLAPAVGSKDELTAALCHVPEWFKGFPLSADTDEVRSYCKD